MCVKHLVQHLAHGGYPVNRAIALLLMNKAGVGEEEQPLERPSPCVELGKSQGKQSECWYKSQGCTGESKTPGSVVLRGSVD